MFYKCRWKGVLGKWKTRTSSPFIVREVFASGVVQIINPREGHTFIEKEEKLRSYEGSENALEKVSLMLVEP